MKNIIKIGYLIVFSVMFLVYVFPNVAVAQPDDPPAPPVQIQNPIASQTLQEFVKDILDIVVKVSMPFLVVMIIYAGFTYVTAQGNSVKVEKAHSMILWTIVGAGIILGAFIIARAIQVTIDNIESDTAYIEELESGNLAGCIFI